MGIIELFRRAFGIFDGLIIILFLANLALLWNRDRSILGIPPSHHKQISPVILELFPVLGLLGTVWGLAKALLTMGNAGDSGLQIREVAVQFGGALTTTFWGLLAVALTLAFGALFSSQSPREDD